MKNSDNITEIKEKLDSLTLKEGDQQIALPDNIKLEIKNVVAELKELLKDDQNFAEELIWAVSNVGNLMYAYNVREGVYLHYEKIINECKESHKPWQYL